MNVDLGIQTSTQGPPEEFSPATPVDTHRLGEYVHGRLASLYPQLRVELFDRDDIGGTDDDYTELRDMMISWAGDDTLVATHIHQDASSDPTDRGWCILYYHPEGLALANEIEAAMSCLDSPYRGTIKRLISATRKPPISCLVEAGFYTSEEDENLGVSAWGDSIVQGIVNYLARHWGIYPNQTPVEEDDMPYIEVDRRGGDLGGFVHIINARLRGGDVVQFYGDLSEDYTMNIYAQPIGREGFIGPTVFDAGGYDNKLGNKGGQFKVADFSENYPGEVYIVMHTPVLIHGNVIR